MSVRVRINEDGIRRIQDSMKEAAFQTIQDVRIDVDQSQTVPFLTGTLNDSAHASEAIRENENGYELHYSSPYAIRRYYEPANFTTTFHGNATDHWLDCYKPGGTKANFCQEKMQEHFAENMRRGGN